jgi:hypothetical protein
VPVASANLEVKPYMLVGTRTDRLVRPAVNNDPTGDVLSADAAQKYDILEMICMENNLDIPHLIRSEPKP